MCRDLFASIFRHHLLTASFNVLYEMGHTDAGFIQMSPEGHAGGLRLKDLDLCCLLSTLKDGCWLKAAMPLTLKAGVKGNRNFIDILPSEYSSTMTDFRNCNRPFPSYPLPLFQNKSIAKLFIWKWVSPTGSFSCKSKSFSFKWFCS